MPKVTSSKTNFTSGELSPFLLGRFDVDRYYNGAKIIENFLLHNAGGAIRRPGSKFVAEVKDSSLSTRLIDFQFSTSQAYILELGEEYFRFCTDNGQVQNTTHAITGATQANPCVITSTDHPFQDGDTVTITTVAGMTQLNGNDYTVANRTANTYALSGINSGAYGAYTSGGLATRSGALEIPNPYSEDELFDVKYAQNADVSYMVHGSHEVMKLSRLSATSWTFTEVDFVRGPFRDDNITAVTITPSADAGAGITLTASAATFESGHIGSLWRVKDGVVKITAYTSGTVVTGTVQAEPDGTAGDLNTGPAAVTDWAEGAWSDVRGFPTAVMFHEQRLVFSMNQTIYASVSQSFENFDKGDAAADDAADNAFIYQIASEQLNAIRWTSSGSKALQVGTSGGTFSFSSGSDGIPITPRAIVVKKDTNYGASSLAPQRIGNFVYFIQRNLKVVRELGFDYDLDTQAALDMTLLSDHITGDGIVDMAHQQTPNDTLWCVRSDGEIATLTRQISQEVIAWARQTSGADSRGAGLYKSVAVTPIDEGDDQVWVIVYRYIDGSYVRYIEYFTPREFEDAHDAFYVDSGLTLDSPITISGATAADPVVITATSHGLSDDDQIKIVDVVGMTELNGNFYLVANKTDHTFELTTLAGDDVDGSDYTAYISGGEAREMVTTISGLDHLEGETVAVAADGGAQPDEVVASGEITLATKVAVAQVGLPYTSTIQGLPLSDGSVKGTGAGQIRRIYKAIVRFYRTVGANFGTEDEQYALNFGGILGRAPDLFTGLKIIDYPRGYDRLGEFCITQSQPLPMNVLSVILLSDVSDE